MRRTLFMLLACLFIGLNDSRGLAQTTSVDVTTDSEAYIRSPRLGITMISLEELHTEDRYERALELGAGWNRWPLYWDRVETAPGEFNWDGYDRLVSDDEAHGLNINAILLGTPTFFLDEVRISGLQEPIFSDQTDTPRVDKKINPKN